MILAQYIGNVNIYQKNTFCIKKQKVFWFNVIYQNSLFFIILWLISIDTAVKTMHTAMIRSETDAVEAESSF